MSGFFNKLKEAFSSKEPTPSFKHYQPTQLKMVAMKSRLVLEQNMETLLQHISKEDQQFKYAGQDSKKLYDILQVIGEKVIEAESLKILIEMMKKVQNYSHQIIQTNGDISRLKRQIQWFQCVLWYRRIKQVTNLEDLYDFCYNFFQGYDITTELNPHCEVFQFYPIIKHLPKGHSMPLQDLLPYIQPYVTCNIEQNTLDNIILISKNIIPPSSPQQPQPKGGGSIIDPRQPHQPSKVYPNSSTYSPYSPPPLPQKQPSNLNPYQSNAYSPDQNQVNVPSTPYAPYNSNPYGSNTNPNPNSNPYGSNNNPYGNNPYGDSFPQNQPEKLNPYPEFPSTIDVGNPGRNNENTLNIPNQKSPSNQKRSLNNMLSGLSNDREPMERQPQGQYGSQVPFQKQIKEPFHDNHYEQTLKDLQALEIQQKLQREKQRQEEERKAKQEQSRIEQQKRLQEERERLQKERQRQQKQKREQEQRQREEQEQLELLELQQELKQQEEQENRQKQLIQAKLQQEEDQRLRILEEEQLKREEELKQIQEQQRQLDWQARQQQRQIQQREDDDIELNVFEDNERQQIDRGMSGRFTMNQGLKVDFGDYQKEEQFSYNSPDQIQNSMLRFKENVPLKPAEESLPVQRDLAKEDELESLQIIRKCGGQPGTTFKLFYFKKIQTS